jgi:hypothetical protein
LNTTLSPLAVGAPALLQLLLLPRGPQRCVASPRLILALKASCAQPHSDMQMKSVMLSLATERPLHATARTSMSHQVRVASATWTELWADVQRLITSYAHAVLVWPLAAPPTHSLFETCEHCVECVGVWAWTCMLPAPSMISTTSVLIDVRTCQWHDMQLHALLQNLCRRMRGVCRDPKPDCR